MPNHRIWRGLYVALATPLADEGTPHLGLLAARAQALLAQGCDGIALFGTTGEGPAFPVAERSAGLEALLAAGVPPERLVVATSATAAGDALALTRHALTLGVSEVLLTPPFFLKTVDDDGLFRFYAEHIARAGSTRLRLLLYHIPSVTGIALGPELIERLAIAFPEVVIGVKDSGADWRFTLQLLERFPRLEILCGEETQLLQALAQGGAGTICGMANLVPELLRHLIERRESAEATVVLERLCALSARIERTGSFHRALRALIAEVTGEPAWLRCLPPMSPLPENSRLALLADFHELIAGSEPDAAARRQSSTAGPMLGR